MLYQVIDPTSKVSAQPINRVRRSAVPLLIQDLRQRHAIKPGGRGDFAHGDSAASLELPLLDHLPKLEPDHRVLVIKR